MAAEPEMKRVESSCDNMWRGIEACALLPVGTIVRVKGNNRTRQDLNGCRGRVLGAAALGGWHTCVVTDRMNRRTQVRLQRNALEVDYDALQLSQQRFSRKDANANADAHGTRKHSDIDELTELSMASSRDTQTESSARPYEGAAVGSRKFAEASKGLEWVPSGRQAASSRVEKVLGNLRYGTLRKYRRAFGLRIGKTHTKQQLAGLVCHHFTNWAVQDESAVVNSFLSALGSTKAATTSRAAAPTSPVKPYHEQGSTGAGPADLKLSSSPTSIAR